MSVGSSDLKYLRCLANVKISLTKFRNLYNSFVEILTKRRLNWCNNLLSTKKRFTTDITLFDGIESIRIVPKKISISLFIYSQYALAAPAKEDRTDISRAPKETSHKGKKNKCAVSLLWCVNGMFNENVKRKKFTRKILWLAKGTYSFSLMLDLIYLLLLILQLDDFCVGFYNHQERRS